MIAKFAAANAERHCSCRSETWMALLPEPNRRVGRFDACRPRVIAPCASTEDVDMRAVCVPNVRCCAFKPCCSACRAECPARSSLFGRHFLREFIDLGGLFAPCRHGPRPIMASAYRQRFLTGYESRSLIVNRSVDVALVAVNFLPPRDQPRREQQRASWFLLPRFIPWIQTAGELARRIGLPYPRADHPGKCQPRAFGPQSNRVVFDRRVRLAF